MVVRHAKAEPTGRRDRDRPLTDRGRGDASAAGAAVAAALGEPATAGRVVALVSSATRAYDTWRQLADRLPVAVDEQVSDALYDAAVDDVLGLVGGLDDGVSAAVVVGHNPTMHATVHTLAGGGDPAALARLDDAASRPGRSPCSYGTAAGPVSLRAAATCRRSRSGGGDSPTLRVRRLRRPPRSPRG